MYIVSTSPEIFETDQKAHHLLARLLQKNNTHCALLKEETFTLDEKEDAFALMLI